MILLSACQKRIDWNGVLDVVRKITRQIAELKFALPLNCFIPGGCVCVNRYNVNTVKTPGRFVVDGREGRLVGPTRQSPIPSFKWYAPGSSTRLIATIGLMRPLPISRVRGRTTKLLPESPLTRTFSVAHPVLSASGGDPETVG